MAFEGYRRPSANHPIDFQKWTKRESVSCTGEDGGGNPAKFIPRCKLAKYWTWKRVRQVLKDYSRAVVSARVDTILSTYICVFSILAFTDHLDCLEMFMEHGLDDKKLPLEQPPSQWPVGRGLEHAFEDFLAYQWKFCPLQISPRTLTGRRLDNRHILPIASKKVLHESNGESEVIQVDFNSDCIDQSLPATMVLKIYTNPAPWRNEVTAFTKIDNSAPNAITPKPQSIIEHYGHFVQNDKHYLLLQCAHSNLDSYFKSAKPPQSAADMFQFWKSMFKLIEGLVIIHNLGGPNEDSTTAYLGSHQDIKPRNILLTGEQLYNNYDITPKIADFGNSDFWERSDEDPNALGIDNKGDQCYSAPECIANNDALRRFDNRVGSEVDIWSLGCVFSEAAVWAVCGQPGLQDYVKRRFEETRRIDSMRRSGFEGCFHNGIEPLDAVTLMHNQILKSRRHWDTITPGIIGLIRDSMLLEHMSGRKSARNLLHLSAHLLQEAQDKARDAGDISRVNTLQSPPPSPPFTSRITIEEILRYRSDMKEHRPPNEFVATQCVLLQEKIKGRDQIFLIDDSTSMKTIHREDVLNTFIALSYLAKRIDENDIDLFFTSQPSNMRHERRTSKLLSQVQQNYNKKPSGTSTREASLSVVIDYIDKKKLPNPHVTFTGIPGVPQWLIQRPRITLFVFTDGLWGNGTGSIVGVEKEIERLIANVKMRHLSRTSVTIQFIRFGNDPLGVERLKYLDDFGKDKDWDIVDSKSHKDHVPDMFIGSIDDAVDNNDNVRL